MDPHDLIDFVGQLEPYPLPAPWERFQKFTYVRQCGSLSLEGLATLRASFSDRDLIELGILEEGPEGPQLSAGLRGQEWIQAHIEDCRRRLGGFSTERGLLTPAGPSLVASLEYAAYHELPPGGFGNIIFASSPTDLAFLTALGFVARTPSTLVAHDPEGHARICRALGWLSPAELADRAAEHFRNADLSKPPTSESRHSPDVVLLNWSPANLRLDSPADFDPVRDHLCGLEHAFGLPLGNLLIWQGEQETVTRLESAAKLGSRDDLYEILCESLAQAGGLHAVEHTPVAPLDFSSASAELHRLAATPDAAQFQAAALAVRDAYRREHASDASTGTSAGNSQARYRRHMHEDMLITKYCEFVRASALSPDGIPKSSLRDYVALMDQLMRLEAPEPW